MKTLKFRAWDNKNKCWFNDGFSLDCDELIIYDSDDFAYNCVENDIIIMQFTGLFDKNGKEIWEGDILTFDPFEWNRNCGKPQSEWEYPKWAVEWDNDNGCWRTGGGLNSECKTYKTIVGNVHENKELVT